MKATCRVSTVLLASISLLVGCTGGEGDSADEEIGEATRALLMNNALTPNALTPNALTPNALTPNALTPNALTPNALTPNSLAPSVKAALEDPTFAGEISRDLFKYMLGCALDSSQSYSFTWHDSNGNAHAETIVGYLGLATDWPSKKLSPSEQQWITACVLARVNWYSMPVDLSARAQHANLHVTDTIEGETYAVFEGAFWGNIFDENPTAYACHDSNTVAHARAAHRDCAAGHVNADGTTTSCGIITIVGDCASHCTSPDASDDYYPSCGLTLSGHDKTHRVISTFLP